MTRSRLAMREKQLNTSGAEWNVWWSAGLPSAPRTPRRVRTGCDSCRRRKLKCDEAKPICLRCARNGHECIYAAKAWIFEPLQSFPKKSQIYLVRPPSATFVQTKDPTSLEFFFRYLAPANSPYHSLECWEPTFVLRLQSEPVIAHLLTALGIVHRAYWDGPDHSADLGRSYYASINAAVSQLVSLKPVPTQASKKMAFPGRMAEIQFLCSLLLVMAEGTRSASAEAIWPHICGLITLFSYRRRLMPVLDADTVANKARLSYARRLIAVSAGMSMSSLSFVNLATFYDYPAMPELLHSVSSVAPTVLPQVACSFLNLGEAARSLENILLFWFLPLLRRSAAWIAPYAPLKIINLLTQWLISFKNNIDSSSRSLISLSDARMIAQLNMHANCAYIAATYVASPTPLSAVHAAVPQFSEIIDALEFITKDYRQDKNPFALYTQLDRSLGIIPPAFFTATHCPDRAIAGRALVFLRSLDVVEGLWNSNLAAKIAETVMAIDQELSADHAGLEIWPRVTAESTECHLIPHNSSPVTPRLTLMPTPPPASSRTVMLRIRCTVFTSTEPPPASPSPHTMLSKPADNIGKIKRTQYTRQVALARPEHRTQTLGPCVRSWGYLAHTDLFPTPYVQSEASAREFMERYIS